MGRMKTIDKRQDKSEDLGPAAVVGTSTLKPRDGGGKVVPPKELVQRSGPPLAFETPANPELVTDVTVGTTNLTPSPLPLEQPPFSPIDAWCGACGSGLWQDIKTARIACLYKKECPIALSNEKPIELTQEQAFGMLAFAVPHLAAVPFSGPADSTEAWHRLISERMDIDYAVVREMAEVAEAHREAEAEQYFSSMQTARKDALERISTLSREIDAGVREALDLKEVEEASSEKPAETAPVEPATIEMNYSPPSRTWAETRDIEAKRAQLVDSVFRSNYGPQAPTAPQLGWAPSALEIEREHIERERIERGREQSLIISSSSGIRIEIPAVLTKDADFVNLLRALRVLLGPA